MNIIKTILKKFHKKELILVAFIFYNFNIFSQDYKIYTEFVTTNPFSDKIYKVFTEKNGNLIVAYDQGIKIWDGLHFTQVDKIEGFNDNSAFNIIQDNNNIIWFNTFSEKLFALKNKEIIRNKITNKLKSFKISSFIQDNKGNYWLGDRYGRIIKIDKTKKLIMNADPSKEHIHKIHRIESISNSRIIAALTFGSFYVLNNNCKIIKKLDWNHDYNWGPANMFNLKNGNIVFCNDKGLHLYNENFILLKTIFFDNKFKGYVSDLKEDWEGNIWIGTKFNLYKLRSDFDKKSLEIIANNIYVNSISIGIENNIWIATNNKGLLKIKKNISKKEIQSKNFILLNNLSIDSVKKYKISKVIKDEKSNIWWAGNRFFGKISDGKYFVYKYIQNIYLNPNKIIIDKHNNIIIIGNNVVLFKTKQNEQVIIESNKINNALDAKLIDSLIFITTQNSGVFILKNYKILSILNLKNLLFSNNCSKIFSYKKYVYLLCENRMFRYEFNKTNVKNIKVYDFNFTNIEITDVKEIKNNTICFTNDSFWQIKINYNKNPIKLEFYSNDLKIDETKNSNFYYHPNETKVTFSSTTFENQDLLLFRYIVIKDKQKSIWKIVKQGNLNFIALEPGNYTIKVENSFDKFNWSNTKVLKFKVLPRYWQSIWFYILVSLIILSLLIYFFITKIKAEKEKRYNIESRLKSLQSQMNPHFVFNALNSIQQFLFKNEIEKSNFYLTSFSKLIRKTFEFSETDYITIEDEMEFLRNYLDIQLLRFENYFSYSIDIEKNIDILKKIPPIIIQPIIENALNHGFNNINRKGILKINIKENNNLLIFNIIDNGKGIENINKIIKNKNNSLFRINERLNILKNVYKNNTIGLIIKSNMNIGTEIEIKIPLIK